MAKIKLGTKEQFEIFKKDSCFHKYDIVAEIYGTKEIIDTSLEKQYDLNDEPTYIILAPYYNSDLYFITDSEGNEFYDSSVLSDLYDRFNAVGSNRKFFAWTDDPNNTNSIWNGRWYVGTEHDLKQESIVAYAEYVLAESREYRNGYLQESASYAFARMFRVLKECSEYKAK